jgi:hypothetical protein
MNKFIQKKSFMRSTQVITGPVRNYVKSGKKSKGKVYIPSLMGLQDAAKYLQYWTRQKYLSKKIKWDGTKLQRKQNFWP